MKKVLLVLAMVAIAMPAAAISILPNVRQVTVNPGDPNEPDLQYLVNGQGVNRSSINPTQVFPGSSLNVQTGQSTAAFFAPSSLFGTSVPTMWFEWTSGKANEFGLFSLDGDTINYLPLFFGPAVGYSEWPGVVNNKATAGGISFNLDGTIDLFGLACGVKTNCGEGFDTINARSFGFYLYTNQQYFHTLDSLNADGQPHVLAFQKPEAAGEWLFAFEDGSSRTGDFQDVGIKIESITAVPEPGSMLLFGTGLFGLAGAVRRRVKK